MQDPGVIQLLAILVAVTVFLVTLVNTNAAVVLLIFSMLLSPEINMANLPHRAVAIRFDDLLLGVIFFTWLAKLAMKKELTLIRSTPLNLPLAMFLVSCAISTGFGLARGYVNGRASFFYLLKYAEYFVLYFMITNVIRDRAQVERFVRMLILTAIIVSVCGYWQMAHEGLATRLTAPFEGEHPEPNTLAGYLLLIMGIVLARAVYASTIQQMWRYAGIAAFLFVPFLFTQSRGGYAAFVVMYLLLVLAAPRRRKLWLIIPMVVLLIGGLSVLPDVVVKRLQHTFAYSDRSSGYLRSAHVPHSSRSQQQMIVMERLGLDPSAAARVDVWFVTFEELWDHPFIGYGVTGAGLVDEQYCLVLGELGLFGMLVFLWTRWMIYRMGRSVLRDLEDPAWRGLVIGYLCAYTGLLVHSFAGNIFIIVRIMEPFWFLTALVAALPRIMAEPASVNTLVLARPVAIPRLA